MKIDGYRKWIVTLYAISAFVALATYTWLDKGMGSVEKMNIFLAAMAGIGGVATGHGLVQGGIDRIKSDFLGGQKQ